MQWPRELQQGVGAPNSVYNGLRHVEAVISKQ